MIDRKYTKKPYPLTESDLEIMPFGDVLELIEHIKEKTKTVANDLPIHLSNVQTIAIFLEKNKKILK